MAPVIFSGTGQRPTDLSAEDQWRPLSYLQYINGVPEDLYRWSLSFVQTSKFAWRLPSGLELFEGRIASLGIDRLDMGCDELTALLQAIAGAGARVAGTDLQLRVARPWLALFEEAAGDKLALPANWLEGLELHGDPLSLWIGSRVRDFPICPNLLDPASESVRRARRHYAELDWSVYRQHKQGWLLRDATDIPPFLTEFEQA